MQISIMVRKSSSYNNHNIYYYYYYYLNMCHKQPDRQITLSMFLLFFWNDKSLTKFRRSLFLLLVRP